MPATARSTAGLRDWPAVHQPRDRRGVGRADQRHTPCPGCGRAGSGSGSHRHRSQDDLVERILDDPLGARRLQARDQVAHGALLDDRVHRHPLVVAQRGDGRPLQRRQQRRARDRDRSPCTFSMMPTRPCASMAALSRSAMLSSLVRFHGFSSAVGLAISCVLDSSTVSMIRSRLARSDEPGLGDLDDGVGERRRLDLGGAPRELDVHRRRRAA